jgi:hypothetical protein
MYRAQQEKGYQRTPDLYAKAVFRGRQIRFNLQVLLHPFEEQLNLPPGLVCLCDLFAAQIEVVGQKLKYFFRFCMVEGNEP